MGKERELVRREDKTGRQIEEKRKLVARGVERWRQRDRERVRE